MKFFSMPSFTKNYKTQSIQKQITKGHVAFLLELFVGCQLICKTVQYLIHKFYVKKL